MTLFGPEPAPPPVKPPKPAPFTACTAELCRNRGRHPEHDIAATCEVMLWVGGSETRRCDRRTVQCRSGFALCDLDSEIIGLR